MLVEEKTTLCSFVANTVFSPNILDQVQDPDPIISFILAEKQYMLYSK